MKKLSCLLLALLLTLTPLAGGIVLPTAADDTAPKITPAPHAYAQGLAAWYAGEQNTRAGQNPESTVWEDLIGGYDMTVRTDAKTRFTAEGLALESSKQYFPQEVCGIVNGSAFTVEIRLGAFASVGDAYNTFMNSDNDNFALFRRNSNNVLEFKWAAVGAGQRPTVENGLTVLQDALVSITYEVGGEVVLYINGTRPRLHRRHGRGQSVHRARGQQGVPHHLPLPALLPPRPVRRGDPAQRRRGRLRRCEEALRAGRAGVAVQRHPQHPRATTPMPPSGRISPVSRTSR